MKPVSSLLKHVHVDPADITADVEMLALIADDLRENGGALTPPAGWVSLEFEAPPKDDRPRLLDRSFSSPAVEARMSTMDKMLAPWVGTMQMAPAAGDATERFRPWLAPHDPLGLWRANFQDAAVAATLSAADLGSAMDLNLLYSFATDPDEPTVVLEVGGGYGRLAEAAMNVFGDVKYVLVDGVPGSLLYARQYLRRACPDARIGFHYDGDPFDPSEFDCYIVPSWHFEAVNTLTYDACVNIESFQEMKPEQVEGFVGLFDRLTHEDSLIYVSNFHNAGPAKGPEILAGSGDWAYPSSWRRLFCSNTPRSTKPDHPSEIFVKAGADCSRTNGQVHAAHAWQSAARQAASPQSIALETYRLARRTAAAVRRRLPGTLGR